MKNNVPIIKMNKPWNERKGRTVLCGFISYAKRGERVSYEKKRNH